MSNFSFADYQNARAQNEASNAGSTGTKVGFFKLSDNGDEAIIRINCSDVNTLDFASIHTASVAGKYTKISCLNPIGAYGDVRCPLCAQAASGNTAISKASNKVYIQMLAAYKDKTTGNFSAAIPVVWERPASFSRDIATLLRDYGDLKTHVFKVTRNGAKGDMKTTYSIAYIPVYDKPELVPADFSAFDNFKISKHSFWEKSAEEIITFLNTGAFPVTANASNATNVAPTAAANYQATTNTGMPNSAPVVNAAPAYTPAPNPQVQQMPNFATPVNQQATQQTAPSAAQTTDQTYPPRNFNFNNF